MFNAKELCPVCDDANLKMLFTTKLPVLQNRVYNTQQEARNSPEGTIALKLCLNCNFVFNSTFNNAIIVYDEHYDNSVPSAVFQKYYDDIARYLYEKYDLENGPVYDVGCGKGTFLKQLCNKYPTVIGIGIDPSYVGDLQPADNLSFIIDVFKKEQVTEKPALVLVRHVFEHMEYPGEFLNAILVPLQQYENVPLFIEVPDFNWIVQQMSFWDICYEHCNYFNHISLEKLLNINGCRLNLISLAFQDQYLWAESTINATNQVARKDKSGDTVVHYLTEESILKFTQSIVQLSTGISAKLAKAKEESWRSVIWGMATKGVIFSNLIDPNCRIVDYCIDINTEKQGKFTPISAHKISGPEVLKEINDEKLLIIIMNPNYIDEIKSMFTSHNAEVNFIDAHGTVL